MGDDINVVKNEIIEAVKGQVLSAIDTEKRELEQKIALANAPKETEKNTEVRELANAIKEKRAISLSGTGVINVVSQMVKVASAKRPLLGMVSTFYGRDASTNIPVWNPSLAVPLNYVEGASNVASDAVAQLGVTSITPYAYISVLPVSNETLALTGANLEAQLPDIFGEAFSKAMMAGILTGSGVGRDMTGLFTATIIPSANLTACKASGLPLMVDLVALALKVQDFYDNGAIVLSPTVYASVMGDTTVGTDVYKEELVRNKTIEGVKVIVTSYAPSAVTAGSVIAVGGDLSSYAMGVASALSIEPLKKVGDNITYFQAVSYFNGKPTLAQNFFGLKTIA